MLNTILFLTTVALFFIGLKQYKRSKVEPIEVEHIEVFPDLDPVQMTYKEKYGYHSKGLKTYQNFWSHQRNKIQRELNK